MAAQVENPFANPFPGMNPYLESRRLWREVHNNIIHGMFRFLRRTLPFRYTVIMDERVPIGNDPSRDAPAQYGAPDLSIRGGGVRERATVTYQTEGRVTARLPLDDETSPEMFITIGERSQEDPVTIVELLSPSNKLTGGHGRSQYLDKRQRVIFSETHLWRSTSFAAAGPCQWKAMTATRHIATSSADGRRARKLTCILSACKRQSPTSRCHCWKRMLTRWSRWVR